MKDRTLARTKDLRTLPLVEVTWIDSATDTRWTDFQEARTRKPIECKTAGRLLKSTRDIVQVAASINKLSHVGDQTTIPRTCVKSIRRLR